MSDNQTTPQQVQEQAPQQVEQPAQNQDNAWIEPYYQMNKDELLNNVDPTTLNQIRNTIGDQQFIDQWKLSEADYNRIIEGQQQTETLVQEEQQPVQETTTIPTSTVYTTQPGVTTGPVRRVYHSGYPYGHHYGGYRSYGGYGYPYGHHYGGYRTYGGYGYPYGTTRYVGSNRVVGQPLRTSVVRAEAPLRTSIVRAETGPTTRIIGDSTLRSSIVRTEEAPVTRTSVVRTQAAPVTRVVAGGDYLRSSIVRTQAAPVTRVVAGTQAPVTRVVAGGDYLRSSYVGAPLRSSYVGAPLRSSYVGAPLRTSYVGAPLRNSSYVVGGTYPGRTSVVRTSGVYRPSTYYPATSTIVPATQNTTTTTN
jgi:hypothetical protein